MIVELVTQSNVIRLWSSFCMITHNRKHLSIVRKPYFVYPKCNRFIKLSVSMALSGFSILFFSLWVSVKKRISSHEHPTLPQIPVQSKKVRYVGGMCVAKLVFPTTQYLIRHCYNNSELWQQKRDPWSSQAVAEPCVSIIASKESAYPESFSEISHKKMTYGCWWLIVFYVYDIWRNILPLVVHFKFDRQWIWHLQKGTRCVCRGIICMWWHYNTRWYLCPCVYVVGC